MAPIRSRLLVALAALICVALTAPALAPAKAARVSAKRAPAKQAGATTCANENLVPTANNLAQVKAAILCLTNRDRATKGLTALKENAKLAKAAMAHSTDMVQHRYFAHDAPDGSHSWDRAKRAGYMRPGEGWTVGENIAWGTDVRATPAQIHEMWMNSAPHRANILRRSFKEIGIGVVIGNPQVSPTDVGATFTADFGVRR
jgi:uncharacterized protein YkwD